MFLGGFELTPTYKSSALQNRFSVKYFLNLVLVDEEDRRYFKQQEVGLWRKQPKAKKSKKTLKGTIPDVHANNNTTTQKSEESQQQSPQVQTETNKTEEN